MNLIHTFEAVQEASLQLLELTDKDINKILHAVADAAIEQTDFILSENLKDLDRMNPANPKYDRLKLTKERLQSIASDIRNVATLPSPLGRTLKKKTLPNGLRIRRVSVPFGVIGNTAQRVAHSASQRSFWRHRHHLRSAPQRQLRCFLTLPEEW